MQHNNNWSVPVWLFGPVYFGLWLLFVPCIDLSLVELATFLCVFSYFMLECFSVILYFNSLFVQCDSKAIITQDPQGYEWGCLHLWEM